jgi:S-adenosyl-L-methionine hydrolase (adenosine-forming)
VNRPIALLTDFGNSDHYAASLKGVILSINPAAKMIDVTHEVSPQNIRQGAFVLLNCFEMFPKGTIFVGVVDPGVGSKRREVCVKTRDYFFVGPDNGLFSAAAHKAGTYEVRQLDNQRYFRHPISATFHGRDMFSPVAAHLSTQDIFKSLGKASNLRVHLHIPTPRMIRNGVKGQVVYMDRFGNGMTNVCIGHMPQGKGRRAKVVLGSAKPVPLKRTFSDGRPQELIALFNSNGTLELAVRDGSAARRHRLKVGSQVSVRWG